MPKVSVLIPSYNCGKYINKAIQSVLTQTEQDFEIIIIDDNSTDNTAQLVLQTSDPRIKYVKNDVNRGPGYSRNVGLRMAQGEWVAFLDADDWFEPDRLRRLIEEAERRQGDLVADDMYFIEDNSALPWGKKLSVRGIKISRPETISLEQFLRYDCGFQIVVKRNFINKKDIRFEESLRNGEDNLFLVECLVNGGNFFVIPEPMYYYRSRPDSLTSNKIQAYRLRQKMSDRLIEIPFIQQNKSLCSILIDRKRKARRAENFYSVLFAIKEKECINALKMVLKYPSVILSFLGLFPKAINVRISKCLNHMNS